MQFSLRTLLFVMLLGGPGLALLWWLRHTWTLQVFAILAVMLAALSLFCGLAHAVCWLGSLLARKLR